MLITRTLNKKLLEAIIHESFTVSPDLGTTEALLDALKHIGFHYATSSGLSINIEDLKTPIEKESLVREANQIIEQISDNWEAGHIASGERFQAIIDLWTQAAEKLKTRIVKHYQNFDPLSSLYVMAFSGARGNMSQVGQLIGMRGLMADQSGKIIDSPIQANFREGLASIDYIISSYGARKGLVDTALKTAEAGYLTRRLVYVGQKAVIRYLDCHTTAGVTFACWKPENLKTLIGHFVLSTKKIIPRVFDKALEKTVQEAGDSFLHEVFMTEDVANQLSKQLPFFIKIRSILTCECQTSVCRKCYGWDLSRRELSDLGDAVGIIAAQSIGEPATQLTLRTFHTGGVFSAAAATNQLLSPTTGMVAISSATVLGTSRTSHGEEISVVKGRCQLILTNWQEQETLVSVAIGSFLYVKDGQFVPKGYPIATTPTPTLDLIPRRFTPVSTPCSGRVLFDNIILDKETDQNVLPGKARKITNREGSLWLIEEVLFSLPRNAFYSKINMLSIDKTLATLKIITPFHGFIQLNENCISIIGGNVPWNEMENRQCLSLEVDEWKEKFINCTMRISILVKNYQYVDEQTTIALLYYYPNSKEHEGEIYSAKFESVETGNHSLFIVPKVNIWSITTEQVNNFSQFRGITRTGYLLHDATQAENSGIFTQKEGLTFHFQAASSLYLAKGTKIYCQEGDFLPAGVKLAFTVRTTQQTLDIVQGLPKLDKLIEAGRPKRAAVLSKRPGLILSALSSATAKAVVADKRIQAMEKLPKWQPRGPLPKEVIRLHYAEETKTRLTYTVEWRPAYSVKKVFSFIFDSKQEEPVTFDKSLWPCKVIYSEDDKQRILLHRYSKNLKTKGDVLGVARFGIFDGKMNDAVEGEAWHTTYAPRSQKRIVDDNVLVLPGQPITEGYVNPHELLSTLCECAHYDHALAIKTLSKRLIKADKMLKQKEEGGKTLVKKLAKRLEKLQQVEKLIMGEEKEKAIKAIKKLEKELKELAGRIAFLKEEEKELQKIQATLVAKLEMNGYEYVRDVYRNVARFRIMLANSILSVYSSQGVNIASKHIEIIVRQLSCKACILNPGSFILNPAKDFLPEEKLEADEFSCHDRERKKTGNEKESEEEEMEIYDEKKAVHTLYESERINLSLMTQIYLAFINSTDKRDLENPPTYTPIYISATRTVTTDVGFLAPAGFQETERVLSKAALHGDYDWFLNLKENIIAGRFIPAGTTFFKKKNTLDEVYFFKETKRLSSAINLEEDKDISNEDELEVEDSGTDEEYNETEENYPLPQF